VAGGDFGLKEVGAAGWGIFCAAYVCGTSVCGAVCVEDVCSSVDCGEASADEEEVPVGSVLIEEEDWFAGRADAGSGAGGLDFHEGDQAVDFGFLRGEFGEDAAEAEGVFAEGGADEVVSSGGAVALVEDEVDDFEDGGEAGGELGAARDFEGNVFLGERAFGADDALSDGGFGGEEGAGDLSGGEAANETEGEGGA